MCNKKPCETRLRRRIAEERRREQMMTAEDVYRHIAAGRIASATGNLLFHTPPSAFAGKLEALLQKVKHACKTETGDLPVHILGFLVELSIDLGSFLPRWVLLKALGNDAIARAAQRTLTALAELTETPARAAEELRGRLRAQTIARLKAEGIADDATARATADHLMGDSLCDYAHNVAAELRSSNLINVAGARFLGRTGTQLGNDYAAFLQHMIRLGGSFVTTNPVLIKLAWDTDPEFWNRRVDELISSRYTAAELEALSKGSNTELNAAVTTINSLVTMAVVEENCRLLRHIFLVTEGQEGYVSLQVNPTNHDEADLMVSEAEALYADLEQRLGGVPNVVFKLPATAAGRSAAQKLTSRGIGVTVTVSFSVFQATGFAKVLSEGEALVCYIALMNGRLAYPVRDELRTDYAQRGVQAARWAGVEVARKAYRMLYGAKEDGGMGVDPERVKLLVASLRVYDDWIPDMTELWGVPVITVFPNVRRQFDRRKRDFVGASVLNTTPPEAMDVLSRSEIFRQAWWTPGDPEKWKPKRMPTLEPEDSEALAAWPPVANTLGQFIDLYEQMGEMVKTRITHLAPLLKNC